MKNEHREKHPIDNQAIADGERTAAGERTHTEQQGAIELRSQIRRLLGEALGIESPEASSAPSIAGEPAPRRSGLFWQAAAALLVVGLIASLVDRGENGATKRQDTTRVRDAEVEIAISSPGPTLTHPFELRPLKLEWKSLTDQRVVMLDRLQFQVAPRQLAEAYVLRGDQTTLPLRMTVELIDVDGQSYKTVKSKTPVDKIAERIANFRRRGPDISLLRWPQFLVRDEGPIEWSDDDPADDAWADMTRRKFRLPEVPVAGEPVNWFRPSGPGTLTTILRFERLPIVEGAWWKPAPPLELRFQTEIGGRYGAWSKPVDGLRARIVAPDTLTADGKYPFGLELENVSDQTFSYNFVGVTRAEIPQPRHFELWIDGKRIPQRRGDLTLGPDLYFTPHPPGTTRWIGSWAMHWGLEDRLKPDNPIEVAFRFEFRPTLVAGKKKVWQGVLQTPPITLELRK